MFIIIDKKRIELPNKLGGWVVEKAMPLDFLNSDWAKNHRRLSVFFNKGIQCSVPGCKCKGAFFVKRLCTNKQNIVRSIHIDLYTIDFQLMTVDHHIPLSKGGKDTLENKFPMCEHHNSRKGSMDAEIFYSKYNNVLVGR